jgi:membrane-associated phospholipid phosphatase
MPRSLRCIFTWILLAAWLDHSPAGATDVSPPENDTAEPKRKDNSNRSPFEVNLALDLGLTFGSMVVLYLPRHLVEGTIEPSCGLACDPLDVNWLDRKVVGNRSEAAGLVSDIGAGTVVALPLLLGAIDTLVTRPEDGWLGYGKDVLILVETLSFTMGATTTVKLLVQRPRPYVYDSTVNDEDKLDAYSSLSFPSAHTSYSFSMATAYSYLYMKRHPDSPVVIPMWIGTYALASTVAILRTEAGDHFYTDVIAGAVLGIGLGLLIPWLHERQTGNPDPGESGSRVSVTPAVTPGGFGLALTIQ